MGDLKREKLNRIKMINFKYRIFSSALLVFSTAVFSQIKEEKLILDRKREPEVKKIEKKKTSIEKEKNYPPEAKSQNPVTYDITNVPAVSDFKTSAIQGEDISPKFDADYQNNYFQIGMGNYGKILADGNISTTLENKMEVGADLHFLSTSGLKRDYDWDSRQSSANLGAFLNSYGEQGKLSINADFGLKNYNYYGIYAFSDVPEVNIDSNVDLQQKVNQFKINGYYDFYSNEILNDIRLKSSMLSDHFGAKESQAEILVNLSKHGVDIEKLNGVRLNGDLGINLEMLKSDFSILDKNTSNFFNATFSPKVTFFKGKSYVMLGSDFSLLNGTNSNQIITEDLKSNKFYWFPKAEIQFAATDQFKFYAGIDGGLKLNSYANLLEQNPYLVADQALVPTETKYHGYFGLRGDIDQNIKYDFSTGFAKINNVMFFQGNNFYDHSLALNPAYGYANTFSAVYDHGTVSEVKGSVQYFPLANLVMDAELNFSKYKLDHYEHILNKPLVKGSLGGKYILLDKKLSLGAKAIFASDMTTNAYSAVTTSPVFEMPENSNEKVGGFADLNLSAEYRIHKNFSIFALGNNLLNAKYQTFRGYKVLGAQILAGVKITF